MMYICLMENEFEKKTVYKRDVIKYVKIYACDMKTQQISGVVHNTMMEFMNWKGLHLNF